MMKALFSCMLTCLRVQGIVKTLEGKMMMVSGGTEGKVFPPQRTTVMSPFNPIFLSNSNLPIVDNGMESGGRGDKKEKKSH